MSGTLHEVYEYAEYLTQRIPWNFQQTHDACLALYLAGLDFNQIEMVIDKAVTMGPFGSGFINAIANLKKRF